MSALVESWTGLALLDPWLLALALLVAAATAWRRRGRQAATFAPAGLAGPDQVTGRPLPRGWRVRLVSLPGVLGTLGLLALVLALARPVERTPLPITTEGIDILLCIDTSSSMTTKDLDAERSRLDLAREAAARFVAGRPHDRIGLVRFARYPDVRCPLTRDHVALRGILEGVTPVEREGPEDATGIGTATARAVQILQGRASRSRVVILLTDGEENVATAHTPEEIAPIHAGQLARENGVRVYAITVGLGDRTPTGEWIELDTSQVRKLAAMTGGRHFEARDADAIAAVYAEIDALETVERDEPRYRVEDRYLAFLLFGLGLLGIGRVLSVTVLEVRP
jgi:Ca-activated chloride channel family protein